MSSGLTWLAAGESGPPLVFLHGIGGGALTFKPQLAAFAGRFHCVAWNMPGYHGSLPLVPMSFAGLAARLVELLDELQLDRVHLVGHSIGGMVAQELAATAPERLLSMTLVATTAAFGGRDESFKREFLARRLAPLDAGRNLAELAPELVASLLGDDPDPGGVELAVKSMAAIDEAAYRAALACLVTFDRREALPGYRLPVLLVAGERDRTAPVATMARMAEKITGSRLVTVAGAGHLVPLERPDAFNAALEGFLAEIHGVHG